MSDFTKRINNSTLFQQKQPNQNIDPIADFKALQFINAVGCNNNGCLDIEPIVDADEKLQNDATNTFGK